MTIDEELQAALDVDPSPEFVARVRMRIADEPAPVRGWRLWWAAGAVAAAAAAIVAVALRPQSTATPPPRVELLAARPLPALSTPQVRSTFARTSVVRVASAESVDVLVDAGEARTLRRLVYGGPMPIDEPFVGPSFSAIVIPPLSIEPLPTGSEGVRQ